MNELANDLRCIGTPISWPRLEAHALAPRDAAISDHLAACPACARCLAHITEDAIALPPLQLAPVVPLHATRTPRVRRWVAAATAIAAAAAIAAIALSRRPAPPVEAAPRVAIKGVGEVAIELVRERAGDIRRGARSYLPGDRWKIVVSCPPGATALLAVHVTIADGATVDRPLPAARIACGNEVALPGAFSLTGGAANRICVAVEGQPACVVVSAERP